MIRWLQITSGRGPQECCWVVFQLTQYLICEAKRKGLQTELIEAIPAEASKTFKSASQAQRSQYLNKKIALARLSQLLRERELESQSILEQHLWQRHNRLERGNAAHLFRGDKFKYVQ